MKIADILNRAADRLSKRGAWTKGADARDANGRDVSDPNDPDAVCWCVGGAIWRETPPDCQIGLVISFFSGAVQGADPIYEWNDKPSRRKHEVIATLKAAAAKAAEQGL